MTSGQLSAQLGNEQLFKEKKLDLSVRTVNWEGNHLNCILDWYSVISYININVIIFWYTVVDTFLTDFEQIFSGIIQYEGDIKLT